jgi:transcriptional regulator
MYLPKHFREDDLTQLHNFMRQYPFALIVTNQDGAPVGSHIPLLLNEQQGPYGTLTGHFALGNQQWQTFDGSQQALVVFQEPHAYISPTWYEEPAKSVPTWNYAVVHAYGTPHLIDDQAELMRLLAAQSKTFEAPIDSPWTFEQSDPWIQKMARGVVGFSLEISRLEGKFKLNQNRSLCDQERVASALSKADNSASTSIASLMHHTIERTRSQHTDQSLGSEQSTQPGKIK